MYTKTEKRESKRKYIKAMLGKIPYIVLGYVFYPFIFRTKVRDKYYSGNYNWWTLQLWYMLNDDELKRFDVDWDIDKVREKGINTDTRWGRFKASHWFNASRNPAQNYAFTHGPELSTHYENQELEIDEVFENGVRVSPLLRAEWVWMTKDGVLDNMGERIVFEASRLGEGLVWYNPTKTSKQLLFRYSKARYYKLFGKYYYVTVQCGAWHSKYDLIIKRQKGKKSFIIA